MSVQTLEHVLATGRGVERSFCCHAHGDSNASASVNVIKGVWVCYACGAHGQVGETRIPEIDHILEVLTGSAPARTYVESWLDVFDADGPSKYWLQRFGKAVAVDNRCGTDPVSGNAAYPMRDPDGRVWGVVVRSDRTPKYRYPHGVSAATTLYGKRKPASVVVLVEGASDVMALEQSGIPEHWVVLGCYGAGTHYPQKQLIVDCNPSLIVCAFDDDDAGRSAAKRTETQLSDVAPVMSHRWGSITVKDAAEAPAEARIQAIRTTITQTAYSQYA